MSSILPTTTKNCLGKIATTRAKETIATSNEMHEYENIVDSIGKEIFGYLLLFIVLSLESVKKQKERT